MNELLWSDEQERRLETSRGRALDSLRRGGITGRDAIVVNTLLTIQAIGENGMELMKEAA